MEKKINKVGRFVEKAVGVALFAYAIFSWMMMIYDLIQCIIKLVKNARIQNNNKTEEVNTVTEIGNK